MIAAEALPVSLPPEGRGGSSLTIWLYLALADSSETLLGLLYFLMFVWTLEACGVSEPLSAGLTRCPSALQGKPLHSDIERHCQQRRLRT